MTRRGGGWQTVWLVVGVLALLAMVVATQKPRPLTRRVSGQVQAVLSVAGEGLNLAVATAVRGVAFMVGLVQAEREVLRLQQALARAQLTVIREQAAVREDARLRALLGLRQDLSQPSVAAQVVGESPASWWQTVVINRGRGDGVAVNDPVLAPTGVVGRVLSVGPHTAVVMVLTNALSGVGAEDGRSGDLGVLMGGGAPDRLTLEMFSNRASVRPGDPVVTSGLGGIFPAGLPLGKVLAVSVQSTGLLEASVLPAAPASSTQEVLVLLGGSG